MYRKYWRSGARSQFDEAALPLGIFNAFGAKARDLSSGKNDQGTLGIEMSFDGLEGISRRARSSHVHDREQHRFQWADGGQ